MSKFSQQHYIAIAELVKANNPALFMQKLPIEDERWGHMNMWQSGAECQQERTVIALADMFAADSPRFQRGRFYHACGLEYLNDWPLSSKCGGSCD